MSEEEFKRLLEEKKRIRIRVKPNSKTRSIMMREGEIVITLKEPAEHNKANKELVKYLSKIMGREVKIIHGLKSKNKEVRID